MDGFGLRVVSDFEARAGIGAPHKPDQDGGGAQGGRSVVTKRGDSGMLVRRSKLALARFLAAK